MEQMNCPLCKKEVFSELSKGCKLCGMPLESEDEEFCSSKCEKAYKKINNL